MDIQNLFYTLASIFMILGIVVLAGLAFTIYYVNKKVHETHKAIIRRVNREFDELKRKPFMIARYAGHILTKTVSSAFG